MGADGNGLLKAAYFGEHWSKQGHRRADHLSIREVVEHLLREIWEYCQEKESVALRGAGRKAWFGH
jgi:hypothetical protein